MKAWERQFAQKLGVALPRAVLAPLEPNAFLRWAWQHGPRLKGTHPLTLSDYAFGLGVSECEVKRDMVRVAAKVRRNQRLGLEPWEGIG